MLANKFSAEQESESKFLTCAGGAWLVFDPEWKENRKLPCKDHLFTLLSSVVTYVIQRVYYVETQAHLNSSTHKYTLPEFSVCEQRAQVACGRKSDPRGRGCPVDHCSLSSTSACHASHIHSRPAQGGLPGLLCCSFWTPQHSLSAVGRGMKGSWLSGSLSHFIYQACQHYNFRW